MMFFVCFFEPRKVMLLLLFLLADFSLILHSRTIIMYSNKAVILHTLSLKTNLLFAHNFIAFNLYLFMMCHHEKSYIK